MSTIVTRAGKGSPLTNTEVDSNFTNLNTDKYQSGDNISVGTLSATGQVTVSGTTPSIAWNDTDGNERGSVFHAGGITYYNATGTGETYGRHRFRRDKNTSDLKTLFETFADGDVTFYKANGTDALVQLDATANNFTVSGQIGIGEKDYGTPGNPNILPLVPLKPLHVYHATTDVTARFESGDVGAGIEFIDQDTTAVVRADDGIFKISADATSAAAASRIEFYVDGTETVEIGGDYLNVAGQIQGTKNNNPVAVLNRTGSNGAVMNFELSGTDKAGFGINSADELFIKVVNTDAVGGIRVDGSTVKPTISGYNANDDACELGSATNRFKNLYLSEGVFLGGVTSLNKLDYYEEGTWTPVLKDALTGGNTAPAQAIAGSYTRIGNQCTLLLRVINVNPADMTAGNDLYVTGLPFAAADLPATFRSLGAVDTTQIHYADTINARIQENTGHMIFSNGAHNGGLSVIDWNDVQNSHADIYAQITYTV